LENFIINWNLYKVNRSPSYNDFENKRLIYTVTFGMKFSGISLN
jgi:hypothetical protein